MGTYEVWSIHGDLVGVFLDPVAAEDAVYRGDGDSCSYSSPSLDSARGGGHCVDVMKTARIW